MTWVRLDDAFSENPKVAALSDSALALWVTGLAYCNRNLTDGFIPNAVGHGQLRWCDGNTIPVIRELENAGLWVAIDTGWQVHDFDAYQPSKAQVLAEREGARERKAKSRKESRRDTAVSSVLPVPVPVPVPQEPEKPSTAQAPRSTPYTEDFERFWKVFPIREDKRKAFGAFKNALKRASLEVILAGVERYKAVLAADPERKPKWAEGWLNGDRWLDETAPTDTDRALRLLRESRGETA